MNVRELYSKYQHPFGDWTLPDKIGVRDDAPTVLAPWWTTAGWYPKVFPVAYCFEEDPYKVVVFMIGHERFDSKPDPKYIGLEGGSWFPNTPEGLADCEQYIKEYINCEPCRHCKYDDFGAMFRCSNCANAKVEMNGTDKALYCDKSGYKVYVGDFYEPWHCHEYCKFFTPKPQLVGVVRDWGSWETQDDYLRNCEYNPNCPLHSMSGKNATCTYDYYMNQQLCYSIAPIHVNDDVVITDVLITRRQWVDQNFDVVHGVRYEMGYNKRNHTYNHRWLFEEPIPFDKAMHGEFPFPTDI